MNHYTKTGTTAVAPGMTLSIRGGALRPRDGLDLNGPDGSQRRVVVEAIGPAQLVFCVENRRAICRPWQAGDPGLYRLPGTSSNWVIEHVEQAAMAGAE